MDSHVGCTGPAGFAGSFATANLSAQTNRITDPTLRPRPAESKALIDAAVAKLPANPAGPVQPTWDSIRANYKDPDWFRDAKFGIMMHWGIYSVPAQRGLVLSNTRDIDTAGLKLEVQNGAAITQNNSPDNPQLPDE